MYLKSLYYRGVRNLASNQLQLGEGLNIFFGDNGAGKSSLLEALSFLTSGRSFRTSKLELIVNEAQEQLTVFAKTDAGTKIGVGYHKGNKLKQIKINGTIVKSLSKLSCIYPTQVLSPESYHLIDSAPLERRKYLDWCLFHVEHNYQTDWKRFNTILKQRNALLKKAKTARINPQEIHLWNQEFCQAAEIINQKRKEIIEKLSDCLNAILNPLAIDFCDSLKLNYYPGYTGELMDKLEQGIKADIESGFTKFGPHKADIKIKVNGYFAKEYLSRGQKKLLINALFLAQTQLLKQKTHKDSLFIIDDFTSELDQDNQRLLLSTLLEQENVQVILSCLQQDSLKWLEKGYNRASMFHVKHGEITAIEPPEIQ